MFNLGLFELTLFGIIALIVLGPDKLPKAAATLGKWYGYMMRTKQRFEADIINELQLLETQEQIKQELANLRATEADIKAQVQQLQGMVNQNRREILNLDGATNIESATQTTPMHGHFYWATMTKIGVCPQPPIYQTPTAYQTPTVIR